METTIKPVCIVIDNTAHALLLWLLAKIREVRGGVYGLEVESLVLIEFQRQNLGRLVLARPPYKVKMKAHEALSLRRILFGIDLEEVIYDITRNSVCEDIRRQLPDLC